VTLKPGEFCLLPACLETRTLTATQSSEWLMATPGER
jgi:hypothetical protein